MKDEIRLNKQVFVRKLYQILMHQPFYDGLIFEGKGKSYLSLVFFIFLLIRHSGRKKKYKAEIGLSFSLKKSDHYSKVNVLKFNKFHTL